MHADEVMVDAALVRTLVAAQVPHWAHLPLAPVPGVGTDNALFRLGEELVVRLPRIQRSVLALEKELRWLPWLAPQLPLPVPVPVTAGEPANGYPWRWAVYTWLPGATPAPDAPLDMQQLAADLADFVAALWQIDAAEGPPPGEHNVNRGEPLAGRDAITRSILPTLHGRIDTAAALAIWQAALDAPPWQGPPRWLHGDLIPLNLLVAGGRLAAIIDFGCLGVGDPAYDLTPAWHLFSAEAQAVFRARTQADDAAWTRARGLALSGSIIAFPYYEHTNPALAGVAWRTIHAALDDWRASG